MLPDGWAYGYGRASDDQARVNAQLAAALLMASGAEHLNVFPDRDGGVMVTGYRAADSFEILALPGASFDVLYESDRESDDERLVANFAALRVFLEEKGWQETSSSASFLRSIMTPEKSVTYVWRSKTLLAEGSPLCLPIARSTPVDQSARISSRSIHLGSWVTHQRSGVLIETSSRPERRWFKHRQPPETFVTTTSTESPTMIAVAC